MSKNILSYVLGGIVVVLLAVIFYLNPNLLTTKSGVDKNTVAKDKIGQQTLDFIQKNLASKDTKFELQGVDEQNGLYEIKFKVMNQEDTAYVTKNGKYLFFQPIDMMPPAPKGFSKTDKPNVDLYVMAFCPYGNQAENTIYPLVKLFGDKINANLHYIVYSNYSSGYPTYCIDKENKYCSMHGIQEVHQDIRELCVAKYQPDKVWDFVEAINKDATAQNVDSKWEAIAQKNGIDVSKIKTCQADEGTALLDQEIALTKQSYPVQDPSKHKSQEKSSISGSPTLLINGTIYDEGRSVKDYQKGICSAFNNAPDECNKTIEENAPDSPSGSCK